MLLIEGALGMRCWRLSIKVLRGASLGRRSQNSPTTPKHNRWSCNLKKMFFSRAMMRWNFWTGSVQRGTSGTFQQPQPQLIWIMRSQHTTTGRPLAPWGRGLRQYQLGAHPPQQAMSQWQTPGNGNITPHRCPIHIRMNGISQNRNGCGPSTQPAGSGTKCIGGTGRMTCESLLRPLAQMPGSQNSVFLASPGSSSTTGAKPPLDA